MRTEEFEKSIHALHERLLQLTVSKGEEYKRRDPNQFANFERIAVEQGLTREQVLMVYLAKHLNSITTYVRDRAKGQEKIYAEPISGRIDDAILYLLLLRGMTIENDEEYGRRVADGVFGQETPDKRGPLPNCRCELTCPDGFAMTGGPTLRDCVKRFDGGHVERIHVAAEQTLHNLGYSWEGGVLWKPPLGPQPDPIHAAFRQMADNAALIPRTLEVGGVTTPQRTIILDPEPGRVLVVSRRYSDGVEACRQLGLPPGACALSAVDQLHGVRPGSRVVFLYFGVGDDPMLAEVTERCEKQGLTLEVMPL